MTEKGRPLWESGATYSEIGNALGVSASVAYKYGKKVWGTRKEKKSPLQWTSAEEDVLRELVEQQLPIAQIAEKTGRSDKAVRVKIGKLGLHYDYRTYGWTKEEDNLLREKYDEVPSVDDLVDVFGKERQTIVTRAWHLGLTRTRSKHMSPNFHGTSESAKRNWENDPERRENLSRKMKDFWENNEEQRRKHSQNAKQQHLDPTYQARMREVQKEGSSIERAVWGYLSVLGLKEDKDWKRHFQVDYYSFDVAVFRPDQRTLLIECQGDYWHTQDRVVRKDKAKHEYIEKYYERDYELVYLWEHEFKFEEKILTKLRNWIGVGVHKRELDFSELAVRRVGPRIARELVENYHYLENLGRGGVYIGCFHGEEPIAVAVFAATAQPNVAEHYGYSHKVTKELSRFVIRPDCQVKNFGSWFLSRAVSLFSRERPDIKFLISYADKTYGHLGTLYKASNWTEAGEVPADYWYAGPDGFVIKKQKAYQHAKKMGETEREYTERMGWKKVYGLEKLRFVKHL